MKTTLIRCTLVPAFMFLFTVTAFSETVPVPAPPPRPDVVKPAQPQKPLPPPPPFGPRPGNLAQNVPMVEKVGPGLFRLGDITINKSAMTVTLPATVNMNKGLLEYLLVRTGGKTHESLLRTSVDPSHLQVAFLLLGLEGSNRPLARQGDPESPQGNLVKITINLLKDGKMVSLQPESWLAKKIDDKMTDVQPLEWVFTGSVIRDKRFLAQLEGSMIAIYHDPIALIDNASVGGESDKIWFVKEGSVPPVGTEVLLIISAR